MQATGQQIEKLPYSHLPSELWHPESFSLTQHGATTRIEMSGWALPDADLGAASSGQFLLNGKPFDEIRYRIYRSDVENNLWQRRNAGYCGFQVASTVPCCSLYPQGAMELSYVNPGPARLVAAQQSWFKCDPARELPLPFANKAFIFRTQTISWTVMPSTRTSNLTSFMISITSTAIGKPTLISWPFCPATSILTIWLS